MLTAPSPTHTSLQHKWRLLCAVVLVAAGLRLWRIDSLPPGLYFDEAYEGQEAWHSYSDPSYRPIFLKGDFGGVPLNAYANAAMFGSFASLAGKLARLPCMSRPPALASWGHRPLWVGARMTKTGQA